ncbi:MAG: ABC transporter ATP-binding protein [Thermoanaerobaculia bacterium]|nr:ABC transporter ATP-binding protein [Thermoanaerobaculia bacterium]
MKSLVVENWRAARALVHRAVPHLQSLLWERRWRLVGGLGLLVIARGASMVLPASTKFVIDEVILGGRMGILGWILAAVVVATLVQAIAGYGLAQLIGVTGLHTVTEARRRMMAHVMRLPVPFFDRGRSGELASRIFFDAEGLTYLVGEGLVRFVGSLLTAAVAAAVLFYLEWHLALLVVVLVVVFSAVQVGGFLRLGPLYGEQHEIIVRSYGRLTELLGGVRVVKAYTAEKRADLTFTRDVHEILRRSRSILSLTSLLTSVSTVGLGLIGVTVMALGASFVSGGVMTLGDLVMFVAFLAVLVAPLNEAVGMASEMARALASLDRMARLQENESEIAGDADREPVDEVAGEVRFDRVRYAYEAGRPVLHELSFVALPGETTALVGPSGAGKSTILRLILGFGEPTGGRVLIDGRDLRDLRQADYRRFLGVVLQEDLLFDGTVLENIRFGLPQASREEAIAAGRLAHCDEFAESFPKGWETVVGERGIRLSTGQRQRVTIARAILADPRILLLDEATSSLDSKSEEHIRAALEALRRGRTTVVIAHRLSTVRTADRILVLDHGRLLEQGTHEDLLRNGKYYRKMWQLQMGSVEETISAVETIED